MPKYIVQFILCVLLFAHCGKKQGSKTSDNAETAVINPDEQTAKTPLVAKRLELVKQVLESNTPVIPFSTSDPNLLAAQNIAFQTPQIIATYKDSALHKNLLSEVFNVRPASANELSMLNRTGQVFKVELYNYGFNLTTIAFVDLAIQKTIKVDYYRQMQPELNEALSKLATDIAIHSPQVQKALGFKPSEAQSIMSATKTALNRTKCERSLHLCAAPTFIKGEKALWAVVDLTDLRLVGVRWTNVGNSGPDKRVSEKTLRYDKVMTCNCRKNTHLKKGDWELDYMLTSSDGLEVTNVKFKGKPVILSAKLVDFHVVYSNTDGFGYSDAVGCPQFSSAAVTAIDEPTVKPTDLEGKQGFCLQQIFLSEQWPKPCNYSYVQGFEFYNDGSFRMAVGSLGRGCGDDGTYRPVSRIVFASAKQQFQQFSNNSWVTWSNEKWNLQNELMQFESGKYAYKLLTSDGGGYLIEPGNGQFENNKGDFAYTYITRHHTDRAEGDADLPTIGPCCNIDFHQGPEKFIDTAPENIVDQPLVFWYVPQLKNNGKPGQQYCWAESYIENGVYKTRTYPCLAGPLFVPFK